MSVGEMPDMNDTERISKIAGRIALKYRACQISSDSSGFYPLQCDTQSKENINETEMERWRCACWKISFV